VEGGRGDPGGGEEGWVSVEFSAEAAGFLLVNSVRYCLGRSSYAPSWCREIVNGYAHLVTENFRRAIVRDIDEWLDLDRFGEKIRLAEQDDWADLRDWLAATFEDCADELARHQWRRA
jgi:hypothetical protein